ncbi:tRNA (guanosine(46)-N7)-methyltransferase TrmB [Nocardioides sp.]|uniref:tRNA (guanosine(46)-N7)-methyltransferase TrmB n=1 Tax=Nocardioides sp. TaxID=35761 RepID=UPI0035133530
MTDARAVTPARPHHRYTEDGRRIREVLTYSRRGSRLTERQQHAWDTERAHYLVPDDDVAEGVDWTAVFGREAPLVVEIGSGVGEATVAVAAARPEANVLAFEVWRPGVADTLLRIAELGLTNVRLCQVDAVWTLEHRVGEGAISELLTFFPDPWHKARHHKRRLVNPAFAALVTQRVAVGGWWRLATDWAEYAAWMQEVLDAEPGLQGGPVPRWDTRPVTRFERKGLAVGRTITDLAYRVSARSSASSSST